MPWPTSMPLAERPERRLAPRSAARAGRCPARRQPRGQGRTSDRPGGRSLLVVPRCTGTSFTARHGPQKQKPAAVTISQTGPKHPGDVLQRRDARDEREPAQHEADDPDPARHAAGTAHEKRAGQPSPRAPSTTGWCRSSGCTAAVDGSSTSWPPPAAPGPSRNSVSRPLPITGDRGAGQTCEGDQWRGASGAGGRPQPTEEARGEDDHQHGPQHGDRSGRRTSVGLLRETCQRRRGVADRLSS